MRDLLAQAAHMLRGKTEDTLLCLTASVRAPKNIGACASLFREESLCVFAPPQRSQAFASLGVGEALGVVGSGSAALDQVRDAATSALRNVLELRAVGCDHAPAPRLFGGLRFFPDHASCAATDPWHSFPDARFVLPRWTLFFQREEAFLQLVVRPADVGKLDGFVDRLGALEAAADATAPSASSHPPGPFDVQDVPSRAGYHKMVASALTDIAQGQFQKVVPARRKEISADAPFDRLEILRKTNESYPDCCRFLLGHIESTFLGATPELLCEKRGTKVYTEALAGTRARSARLDDDELKRSLLSDDKERREHAIVIDAIVESLAARCAAPPQVAKTAIRTLRTLHHLCTPIELELSGSSHVLDLVSLLHPTPAVCGLPRSAAAQFLRRTESVPRGMYAAPVGYFDASGDGAFWVAIRSVLLTGKQAFLYAGAGVVSGSVAEKEFEETSAKLAAMLTALGVPT